MKTQSSAESLWKHKVQQSHYENTKFSKATMKTQSSAKPLLKHKVQQSHYENTKFSKATMKTQSSAKPLRKHKVQQSHYENTKFSKATTKTQSSAKPLLKHKVQQSHYENTKFSKATTKTQSSAKPLRKHKVQQSHYENTSNKVKYHNFENRPSEQFHFNISRHILNQFVTKALCWKNWLVPLKSSRRLHDLVDDGTAILRIVSNCVPVATSLTYQMAWTFQYLRCGNFHISSKLTL